jgi:hypothetical protein
MSRFFILADGKESFGEIYQLRFQCPSVREASRATTLHGL